MTSLEASAYIRERLDPEPGDKLYLHLSDLRIALERLMPMHQFRVLDYGCGGSPYRSMFKANLYHRADLPGGVNLDCEIGPESALPLTSGSYDVVLSSQVLEHVESPSAYLAEARRVLVKGGCMLITTHGIFEDHGCPYDYRRWTGFGLEKELRGAGFDLRRLLKLTTGPRAAMFIAERELYRIRFRSNHLFDLASNLGVRLFGRISARRRHLSCDSSFSDFRVVEGSLDGHSMYIALAAVAEAV